MVLTTLTTFFAGLDTSALPHRVEVGKGDVTGVITFVLQMLAIVAVLMIVIGGIRYATSQGDPQTVSQAKSTIVYAVAGLLVAISAVAVVQFVSGRLF